MSTEATDAEWTAHFVASLGLELWSEDGVTHGRANLLPEMWAVGTESPRMGVLATMVDIVAGCPSGGALNPTVDLRLTLLARPPSRGTVLLRCQPVKVGRRLFVGETILHTGNPDRPFARSTCTFMNQRIGDWEPTFGRPAPGPLGFPSFDELLRPRRAAPGVLEMDAHASVSNGPGGTVQGGAQALLAELAGAHALDALAAGLSAVDLEIRFLNRVRADTVVAAAEVLGGNLDTVAVRVPIHDADADRRIVSLVSLGFQRL
jgi:acyl-coenzyme A thioesterase PaaI-like protein